MLHVRIASIHAVHTNRGILFVDLTDSHVGDTGDGVQTAVLRKGERNVLQGVGKGADGVLLNSTHGVGVLGHLDGTSHFSGATAVDDVVVLRQ